MLWLKKFEFVLNKPKRLCSRNCSHAMDEYEELPILSTYYQGIVFYNAKEIAAAFGGQLLDRFMEDGQERCKIQTSEGVLVTVEHIVHKKRVVLDVCGQGWARQEEIVYANWMPAFRMMMEVIGCVVKDCIQLWWMPPAERRHWPKLGQ